MVKVTIENDKNKDEITGEFFMGLMLTKEENTEDSATYKACMIGKGNTFIEVNPQDDYIRFRAGAIYEGYSGSAGLSGKLVYSDESYLVVRNGRITGGRIKKSDGTWEELKNGTN